MNWILSLLMLFAALSGCASPYPVSNEGLQYRSSLTESEALRVVEQNIQKSNEQTGLCSAHTNEQFQNATLVKVRGPNVEFESFYRVITGSSMKMSPGQMTTTLQEKRKGNFIVNMNELDKIKVYSQVSAFRCPDPLQGEYIVMLDTKGSVDVEKQRPSAVMINVSAKNLDHFLAALTFLSPQAKLIRGKKL